MKAFCAFILFTSCLINVHSQAVPVKNDSAFVENDTLKQDQFLKQLGNGYFPTKFVNVDLRYLVKYNQYEGLRTGLGGITTSSFSEKYRINGYTVYGFKDHRFKYSVGGGFRVNKKTQTWINLSYTDDLQETGSSMFLTDKRFFSFFEPRLLNIDLFHKHITKAISLEHKLSPYLLSETQFSLSKIDPTYNYIFLVDGDTYENFDISSVKLSLQWNPFSNFTIENDNVIETKTGYPEFTLQLTKSFKNLLDGDFNFFKFDFRTHYQYKFMTGSIFDAVLTSGIATGQTPLTHLYHAYPNNINKETILQRFSVAGINSFETMFFNEFFSDKFTTLQLKHSLQPFKISKRFKPQLVLISRFAIGNMQYIDRHQQLSFETLDKGYSEAGFEINKLLFGFGLSFAYRYGAYHLPEIGDNIAFKFTFNVSL
ncbi:hypothetical protein OE09_2757 [Flavobacteriaceae bacterium MAR_2010_72]|nr:hypothetical protein OE09_2757 [Flavobacteriaceae bacterium MAR_2010_72]TVZ58547.1 hypothetical protein NA63_1049 [Flavobacteriaceae bacterium MAR_2010_105]